MSIQTFTEPCHLPCPDMVAHSLNKEQKAKGLENLQEVRANLKERRLNSLLSQRAKLVAQGENTHSLTEQLKLKREIKLIDLEASRFKQRWS
ncbi:hypothetical protein [Vibrio europaeus]|uniref:hypothetical protein n=1 Tax=Vibrio europaeus TaxID=300876 RepID=UPI00233EA7BA|nr:hypothetical protein [Vibrio europaeus]MDC5855511.1 hypothetical protein [Vibrio europaeus]